MLYPNDLTKFKVKHKLKRNLCSKEFDKAKKFRKKILNIKEVKKNNLKLLVLLPFPLYMFYLSQRLHITTINYI